MKEESLTEEFIDNSIWSTLLAVLTKAGGFIFTLILARFLMPEGFGVYSFILAIATILMTFGDLGINQSLTVLLSKNKKSKTKFHSYFRFFYYIKLSLLIAISLIFILAIWIIKPDYSAEPTFAWTIIFCAIYIFFFSLASFFSSFFYIYQKIKIDFFKELLFQVTRFLLIVFVLFFLNKIYHIVGVFFTLAVSSAFIFTYSYFFSRRIVPFAYSKNPQKEKIPKKRTLKILFYFMISALSLVIFSEVDILMMGFLIKDLIYVGYYRAYFAIILGISGLLSFGQILLPIFSSFDKNRLINVVNRVSKYILLIAIPACFGMLSFGSYFIRFFYGAEYLPGITILYFLVFLIISEPITNLLNTILSSRVKPKIIALFLIISIVLNIILNYVLVSLFLRVSSELAFSGVAIATLISRYFFMLCLGIYANKNFGIFISTKNIVRPIIASVIMALIIWFSSRNVDMNLILGAFFVLIGIIIYFAVLFIINGISKEDRIITDILTKKLKSLTRIK